MEVNQISNAEQYAGLNGSRLQRFGIVPTIVPFGGLIKTVVPPGGNILIYFYRFLQKMQFVKSIVYLLEQVQCICLDLCIYNILRNTEETSSKHHTTTTYMEPPREEKRKAEKHVAEKHRKRKKERWATLGEISRKWPQTDKSGIQNKYRVKSWGFVHRVVQWGSLT